MGTTRRDGPRQMLRDALAARCVLALNPIHCLIELGTKAGVGVKTIARATSGGHISTDEYLRLCAAIEFDPMAGFGPAYYGRHSSFPEPADFDFGFFALALQLRQRLNRHSDNAASRLIGIKGGSLARLKAGYREPVGSVLRACVYIQVHPFGYLTTLTGRQKRGTMFHVKQRAAALRVE
jgi:hypothetical protein